MPSTIFACLSVSVFVRLQEMDKFQKAFKDPEFLKMFAEYAQEISDPKVSEF